MIPRGIPIAQIDSDTELDSKIQKLARRLSATDYYAAFGAYMSIVLRAWGTASRETDLDLLDMIPGEIVTTLRECGLLDASGSIPEAVFAARVGAVLDARRKDAARKRTPQDSAGLRRTPQDSNESSSPLLSSGDSQENDVLGNDGGVQGGDDDPVVTYFTLTARYPKGNALAWVKRLGDTYGFASSSEKMRAAWCADDTIGTLLSRTEDFLVAGERAAELREKAAEKERVRQKRAAVRLPQVIVDPDPAKVGEIMGDIRKALAR